MVLHSFGRSAWIAYVLICDEAGTLTRIEWPKGFASCRECLPGDPVLKDQLHPVRRAEVQILPDEILFETPGPDGPRRYK
jgi:hypothetical protein